MSDGTRFTHTDKDGDNIAVRAGMLGAILWVSTEDNFEGGVAVHYEDLPDLISALQGILEESCDGSSTCDSMSHIDGCFATNPDYCEAAK